MGAQVFVKRGASIPGVGSDLKELQHARALWQQNRFDEALELFEETARRYPQNRVALIDGSRALGARFEIGRAEVLLDKLMKLGWREPEILHLAGQSYRMIFRPEKAIECFQRAISLSRRIPDAYLELAVLFERRHRIDEALRLVEECLRSEPDYLEAKLFKGRLLRRARETAGAEALFGELAGNEEAHPLVRAQAWAEMARAHDLREEFDAAMGAMMRCKEILRQFEGSVGYDSAGAMRQLDELAGSVTRGDFERWAEIGKEFPERRMAVLTSFPRSGTTLLEQVLDAHTGLVSSDEREAFARDIFPAMWLGYGASGPSVRALDQVPRERLVLLRDRYFAYMTAALNEPIGERVHLDKNPTLTVVLPGFLRLFPEARLLIALRDPRDVVMSCFMQYLPINSNSVCFLTLERAARRYEHDMALWRNLRDKIASPWKEVRYESTVLDLEKEAGRVLEFLELPWEEGVLNYREHSAKKAVGSPTYEAVNQPLYTRSIGRWRNYEKYLAPYLPILEPSVKAFGY